MLCPRSSTRSMMNARRGFRSTMVYSTKTLSESVMAIFNFPVQRPDHVARAVLAAPEIQRRCEARRGSLVAENTALTGSELGAGIGIDSGQASFGEFGRSHRDLTA